MAKRRRKTKKELPQRKVVWKSGFRKSHLADAEAVDEELNQIRADNDGNLPPEAIVEATKDPDSAMHGLFTWNRAEAVRIQWVSEAREVVRAIHYKFVEDPKRKTVRRYELVPESWKAGKARPYRPTEELMQNREDAQAILYRCIGDFEALRRKWGWLTQLDEFFSAMDIAEDQLRTHYDSLIPAGEP